jgi:hypothetical protein
MEQAKGGCSFTEMITGYSYLRLDIKIVYEITKGIFPALGLHSFRIFTEKRIRPKIGWTMA